MITAQGAGRSTPTISLRAVIGPLSSACRSVRRSRGSLGTISLRDRAPRRTWWRRLLTFAAILGPGIIVMTGDNDAGGVQTYTQAGQQYSNSLMWVLAALFVVLFAAREMVTRLGAVTGVGHARLIRVVHSVRHIATSGVAQTGDLCATGSGASVMTSWLALKDLQVSGPGSVIHDAVVGTAGAGCSGAGTVPGEHLRGRPAVQPIRSPSAPPRNW
jgi:hypothetical protein